MATFVFVVIQCCATGRQPSGQTPWRINSSRPRLNAANRTSTHECSDGRRITTIAQRHQRDGTAKRTVGAVDEEMDIAASAHSSSLSNLSASSRLIGRYVDTGFPRVRIHSPESASAHSDRRAVRLEHSSNFSVQGRRHTAGADRLKTARAKRLSMDTDSLGRSWSGARFYKPPPKATSNNPTKGRKGQTSTRARTKRSAKR